MKSSFRQTALINHAASPRKWRIQVAKAAANALLTGNPKKAVRRLKEEQSNRRIANTAIAAVWSNRNLRDLFGAPISILEYGRKRVKFSRFESKIWYEVTKKGEFLMYGMVPITDYQAHVRIEALIKVLADHDPRWQCAHSNIRTQRHQKLAKFHM